MRATPRSTRRSGPRRKPLPGYQEAMSRYLPPESQAPPTARRPARRPAPPPSAPTSQGRQKSSSSRPAATRRAAPQARPQSRPQARQQTPPRKPPPRPGSRPSRPSRPPASRPRGGGTFGVKAVLIIIGAIFALIVGRAVIGELTDHFGGGSASSEAPAPQCTGNPGGTSARPAQLPAPPPSAQDQWPDPGRFPDPHRAGQRHDRPAGEAARSGPATVLPRRSRPGQAPGGRCIHRARGTRDRG
jgi:hypothetical protein